MRVIMDMLQADIVKRILYAEQNEAKKRMNHAHSHGDTNYHETEFCAIAQVLGNIDVAISEE